MRVERYPGADPHDTAVAPAEPELEVSLRAQEEAPAARSRPAGHQPLHALRRRRREDVGPHLEAPRQPEGRGARHDHIGAGSDRLHTALVLAAHGGLELLLSEPRPLEAPAAAPS